MNNQVIHSCAHERIYFEPLPTQILIHFNSLMKSYQAEEEENEASE